MGWVRLQRQAERRLGLFTAAQALDAGISRSALRHAVSTERVRSVVRGVYSFERSLSERHVVLARCLTAGGAASHWTAARVYGLDGAPAMPVHIVVQLGTTRRSRGGVAMHHSSVALRRVMLDHIPVTSPARTLVDLAALGACERDLEELIALFVTRGFATVARLRTSLGRECGSLPGLDRARRALAGLGPVESVLEARLLRLLAEWGLPAPVVQHTVGVDERRYRLDVAWPTRSVAVEVDGYAHHSARDAFERDRSRHNDLTAAGWTVLHATADQIKTSSPALRRQIELALARSGTLPRHAGVSGRGCAAARALVRLSA